MSVVKTMNPLLGDVLKHEYAAPNAGNFCRDVITVVSGSGVLKLGSVLAKITASGKYAMHNPAAVDGTEATTALVMLVEDLDATSADVKTGALVRGPAIVAKAQLVLHANVDQAGEKSAVYAGLGALHIIVRDVA